MAMGALILAIAALYAYFPVKGLVVRTFLMPPVLASPCITEVDAASSAQQRQRFVDAWRGRTCAGLHQCVSTIEGDPLNLWAITEQGRLTLVTDYTRDAYSHRGVDVQHPIEVEVWQKRDSNPLRAWFPRDDRPYLRFIMADGSDAFF